MKHPSFVCAGTSDPTVCSGLPHYKNFQTHGLCILHYPEKKNLKLFEEAATKKLESRDFNFDGVRFPDEMNAEFEEEEFLTDVNFSHCTFNGAVSFRGCTFKMKANFTESVFKEPVNFEGGSFLGEADFSESIFENYLELSAVEFLAPCKFAGSSFEGYVDFSVGFQNSVDFSGSTFNGNVDFEDSEFWEEASFFGSTFELNVNFTETKFSKEVNFDFAIFRDSVRFGTPTWGGSYFGFEEGRLSLEHSIIEHPDRFSFHTVT